MTWHSSPAISEIVSNREAASRGLHRKFGSQMKSNEIDPTLLNLRSIRIQQRPSIERDAGTTRLQSHQSVEFDTVCAMDAEDALRLTTRFAFYDNGRGYRANRTR